MVGFSQPDSGSTAKDSEIQDPAQLKSAANPPEPSRGESRAGTARFRFEQDHPGVKKL